MIGGCLGWLDRDCRCGRERSGAPGCQQAQTTGRPRNRVRCLGCVNSCQEVLYLNFIGKSLIYKVTGRRIRTELPGAGLLPGPGWRVLWTQSAHQACHARRRWAGVSTARHSRPARLAWKPYRTKAIWTPRTLRKPLSVKSIGLWSPSATNGPSRNASYLLPTPVAMASLLDCRSQFSLGLVSITVRLQLTVQANDRLPRCKVPRLAVVVHVDLNTKQLAGWRIIF